MFCTSCGHEIQPGMKFCTHCGKPAAEQESSAPAQVQAESQNSNTNTFHAADYGEKVYASGKHKSAPAAEPATPAQPEIPVQPENPAAGGEQPKGNSAAEPRGNYTPPPQPEQGTPEYPRIDFTNTNFIPPQPERRSAAPRRSRGNSGSKPLLIGLIALAAGILVVVISLLAVAWTDRGHIDTVKSGYLGVYTDRTVQDVFYRYCGAEYDTAVWEGSSTGFLSRGVRLTFTNSEEPERAPYTVTFAMGKDGTFKVIDLSTSGIDTDDEEALARMLNLHYFDMASYGEQVLSSAPTNSVLYGASAEYEGDRGFICKVFDEKPGDYSLLSLVDEGNAGTTGEEGTSDDGTAGDKTEGGKTEGGKTDGADPTPAPDATPEPEVLHIADGLYYDVNTDYRMLEMTHHTGEDGETVYQFTLKIFQDNVTTVIYEGSGTWSPYEEGVFFDGRHTEVVSAGGKVYPTLVRDAFPGKLWMEEDCVVFGDEETGVSIRFSPKEKQMIIPAIDASVSANKPSLDYGSIRVITAKASSTIEQETVTNDPIVMFDGDDTTSWQEGVDGFGIGEEVTFTFNGLQRIEAMSFKLGNWRNDRYYNGNAAPKTLTLIIDNFRTQVTFDHARTTQWVTFSAPLYAQSITIVIDDVYAGTDYEDTCINEITVYGEAHE